MTSHAIPDGNGLWEAGRYRVTLEADLDSVSPHPYPSDLLGPWIETALRELEAHEGLDSVKIATRGGRQLTLEIVADVTLPETGPTSPHERVNDAVTEAIESCSGTWSSAALVAAGLQALTDDGQVRE